jgi:hypothetical protein
MKRVYTMSLLVSSLLAMAGRPCEAQITMFGKKAYGLPRSVELSGGIGFSYVKKSYGIVELDELGEVSRTARAGLEVYDVQVSPGVGVFAVKGLEVVFEPVFIFSQVDYEPVEGVPDYGSKEFGGGLDIFVRYVVDTRSAVGPFVGVGFGVTGGKTCGLLGRRDFNAFGLGPQAGLKFLFARRGILTLSFGYWFESRGEEGARSREERHGVLLGTGLGFWL